MGEFETEGEEDNDGDDGRRYQTEEMQRQRLYYPRRTNTIPEAKANGAGPGRRRRGAEDDDGAGGVNGARAIVDMSRLDPNNRDNW